MNKLRRAVNLLFLIFIGSGIAYYLYAFSTAEARVKEECSQIRPGMSISQLRVFGEEHGLNQPRGENGIVFMVETRTFGRYGCKVTLDAGTVKNVEYNFAS